MRSMQGLPSIIIVSVLLDFLFIIQLLRGVERVILRAPLPLQPLLVICRAVPAVAAATQLPQQLLPSHHHRGRARADCRCCVRGALAACWWRRAAAGNDRRYIRCCPAALIDCNYIRRLGVHRLAPTQVRRGNDGDFQPV